MTTESPTRPTIEVSPDSRDQLKIQAIAHGKTLKDDVIDAPMERIGRDSVAEDKVWGELSEKAKQAGLLSVEESEGLLTRMKNA